MQRQNALFDAKKKISFNIKSVISSESTENINIYDESIAVNSINNIDSFSEVVLNDIKQFDAYINDSNELFLLIGLSSSNIPLESKARNLKKFNNQELMNSGCYDKNILSSITTSSKIYNDKPIWFYEDYKERFYSSIGITEKKDENYYAQKSAAILLAKSNLMKKIKSSVSSKMKLMNMLKHNETASLLESSGTYKSSARVKSVNVADIWMDPKSCELYVLVYSSK